MIKPLLAGVAAIALTMGAASAQTTVETTTTRTTTVAPAPVPPPIEPYNATRTERTTFGGASTEVQQSYHRSLDGTAATKQETIVRPDGSSETVTHEERNTVAVPPPIPSVGTISTTTTRTYR